MTVSQGEAFDPAPANIEKHVTRLKLPDGLKLAMLPKTSRGGTVSAALELEFGDDDGAGGKERGRQHDRSAADARNQESDAPADSG